MARTPYTNFHDLNLNWIIEKIKTVFTPDNPPPYPVTSVNQKTGAVDLKGTDIPVSANDPQTITNALGSKYEKPASGIPASDLAPGVIPDPTSIIDDNAGYQVYDKTWSAHKLFQQEADILDLQIDKQDAPASAGTAGQVLGLNSSLQPEWVDMPEAQMLEAVDDWLSENITNPSNPPLDRSLLLANACAPADMVGDLKNETNVILDNVSYGTTCEIGAIRSADGVNVNSTTTVRTDFIKVVNGTSIIFKPDVSDFPTGYYLDIRKYTTDKEYILGSGERLGIVNNDYIYTAQNEGYLRFQMSGVNQITITAEIVQTLTNCVYIVIIAKDYNTIKNKASESYSFINNNLPNFSDQMYRNNLYKIVDLTGTERNGFYSTDGVWRNSENFKTLIVPNNDNTIFGYLYSGIVYNNTCAGVVWLNEQLVPQEYDLTTSIFIKHDSKYVVNKSYPYVAFCTYTGYNTTLKAVGITPGSPFEQLSLVITGDSLETAEGGKWCELLANKLGVQTYTNCAVGGTCMSPAYNSATAISGDTRISAMPETADIVLIGGGTNDWGNNIVLGDLSTLENTSTFSGAVDSMIQKMHTKYPDAIIVFTSNQFTISPNRHNFIDQTGILNNQSKSAGDYADMMKSVCEYRGIPYVPMYQQCGINQYNYTHWLLEETNTYNDTVFMHPNSAGSKLMLRVIENAFRNYILPVPEFAK